jgi:hypothetical protein
METKKKGCKTCKNKKPITELPPVIEIEDMLPTREEILLAYTELGNRGTHKREFVNKVYSSIFGEEFDFNCQSCVNTQSRKFKNYIEQALNMKL